jgi:hypothetical protein
MVCYERVHALLRLVYPGIHEAPFCVFARSVYDDDDLGKRRRGRTEEENDSELMPNKQF